MLTTATNTRQHSVHCTHTTCNSRHLEWFGRRNIHLDSRTGIRSAPNMFISLQRQGRTDQFHISVTDIAGSLPGCIIRVMLRGPGYGNNIQIKGAHILPCFSVQENSSSQSVIINFSKYFIVQTGFNVRTVQRMSRGFQQAGGRRRPIKQQRRRINDAMGRRG